MANYKKITEAAVKKVGDEARSQEVETLIREGRELLTNLPK
jgi:hypothetical protein